MVSPAPDATVVVPTRDRPASLTRCLRALESQQHAGQLEIVVVDDGSADAQSVERIVAASPRARLLRLEGVGPGAARNRGAEAGLASMVLFTDDDCEPQPDWVARLVAVLGTGADAAQGRTVNGLYDNPFSEASQIIANHLVETSLAEPGRPPFATSNNLACTHETITATPFDTGYRGAGGEDRDWCARLAASGSRLVRDPEAVVVHRHVLLVGSFWRQHVAYGRGARRFRRDHPEAGAREPTSFYLDLLRSALGRGAAVGALTAVAQVATAVGYARGAIGGRHDDRD